MVPGSKRNNRRRKVRHGFRNRMRKSAHVINNRRKKGRKRLAA